MTITKLIKRLYLDYDAEWAGFLYRASVESGGHLYHTDQEGAKFYLDNSPQNKVRVYECPNIDCILLDTDSHFDVPTQQDGVLTVGIPYLSKFGDINDWVNVMDDALPLIVKEFGAVVINGETGAEVWGTPVEVALGSSPRETTQPSALATLR